MMTLDTERIQWKPETATAPSWNSEPAGYRTGRWLVKADVARLETLCSFKDRRSARFFQERFSGCRVRSQWGRA